MSDKQQQGRPLISLTDQTYSLIIRQLENQRAVFITQQTMFREGSKGRENYEHKINTFNAAIAELEATSDMEPVPDGYYYDDDYSLRLEVSQQGRTLHFWGSDDGQPHRLPEGWQLMRPREVSDGEI